MIVQFIFVLFSRLYRCERKINQREKERRQGKDGSGKGWITLRDFINRAITSILTFHGTTNMAVVVGPLEAKKPICE